MEFTKKHKLQVIEDFIRELYGEATSVNILVTPEKMDITVRELPYSNDNSIQTLNGSWIGKRGVL